MVSSGREEGMNCSPGFLFPQNSLFPKTVFFMEYQQTQCTHSQRVNVQTNRDIFKGRVRLFNQEMA